MPRPIIKLTDPESGMAYYLEWSTVVDAPVTYGMNLIEFKTHYESEYGAAGMRDLDERLSRVQASGCSSHRFDLDELIECNRAGPNESQISKAEILERYCINPPD